MCNNKINNHIDSNIHQHVLSDDEIMIYQNIIDKFERQRNYILHNQTKEYDFRLLNKQIIEFNNYITIIKSQKNMNSFRKEIIESSRDIIPAIDNIINRNFNIINENFYSIIKQFRNVKKRYYDTMLYKFI